MNGPTLQCQLHLSSGRRSRKEVQSGQRPPAVPSGKIPRLSRLMALALRFEKLIADGVVANHSELAQLGHVTRARVTQIMNLLNLSVAIQEAILSLPPTLQGKDAVTEKDMRPIAAKMDWKEQQQMWDALILK